MTAPPPNSIQSKRFRELLSRVRDGDEEAGKTIVEEYGRHILRAVRRCMNSRIRDRFDSEDFAQAVWASFFGHLSIVSRIDNERQLAGFLGRMASNKVIDAGRRQKSRPASNASHEELPEVVHDHRRRVSEPTPSQFAVANEQWDAIANDENDRNHKILQMLKAGVPRPEIAAAAGVSERHLRRVMQRIKGKPGVDYDEQDAV